MLIFQYGSNVDISRLNDLERLSGHARLVGLATTVEGFELCFNVYSRGQACGVANLVPEGRTIYGALYDIPVERVCRDKKINGRKTLDEIEGEGSRYHRKPITVCCNGKKYEASTYQASPDSAELKTTLTYASHITGGLQNLVAPQEYIDYVKRCIERSRALP